MDTAILSRESLALFVRDDGVVMLYAVDSHIHGVLVIAKPVNKHLFHHFLQFTECFKMRMFRVIEENEKLKHMVADMKIINRAKFLLITCLNMSEDQAHRYLEKQAMDLRTSKLEVAKQVIRTYEN